MGIGQIFGEYNLFNYSSPAVSFFNPCENFGSEFNSSFYYPQLQLQSSWENALGFNLNSGWIPSLFSGSPYSSSLFCPEVFSRVAAPWGYPSGSGGFSPECEIDPIWGPRVDPQMMIDRTLQNFYVGQDKIMNGAFEASMCEERDIGGPRVDPP
ncbi:MAG: hypothetical protein M1421_04645 [Candidatus Eremiobacteraeota bacterium]|nr:hypothetical protein [Candidatus Eremiobacteraeota bacterium]